MTVLAGRLAGAALLSDDRTRRALALLDGEGEEARIVGGAVRNALMGLEETDIDICTTATPDDILRRAAAAGVRAIPTGIEHGTVTLLIGGRSYEATTLREDIETDGRRARVRFGRSFEMDALRRDFTINALSVTAGGDVHDYAGGIGDIDARRVRFIGDAEQRIREDFLRILRLFRFSAAYGEGSVDADGLAAAVRNIAGIDQLSRERIGQETLKLLVQPRAGDIAQTMAEHGFWRSILGGEADVARFRRLIAIEAALGEKPDAVRRLAALGVFGDGDADRLQERLRLSGAQAGRLEATSRRPLAPRGRGSPERSGGRGEGGSRPRDMSFDPSSGAPPGARPGSRHLLPQGEKGSAPFEVFLYRLGPGAYRDAVLAAWTDAQSTADDEAWTEAFRLPERWSAPKFLITGAHVMSAGVAKGPLVGRLLAAVEDDWIAAGMPEDEAAQLALLRGALDEQPRWLNADN